MRICQFPAPSPCVEFAATVTEFVLLLFLHQSPLAWAGWMLKKGRKRTNWKQRWFVLAGPFFLYYDSPEAQVAHDVLDDNFLFLKGFTLITNKQLRAGECEIRSYAHDVVQRTVANHPDCFVLQDSSRELFLDPPPQSARSHSTAKRHRNGRTSAVPRCG